MGEKILLSPAKAIDKCLAFSVYLLLLNWKANLADENSAAKKFAKFCTQKIDCGLIVCSALLARVKIEYEGRIMMFDRSEDARRIKFRWEDVWSLKMSKSCYSELLLLLKLKKKGMGMPDIIK